MSSIIRIMWSKMSDGLRSRFRYGGAMEGDDTKDGLDNVTNDVGLKSIICEEPASNGSSYEILVPEVRVEKETIACETVGDGKNDDFSVPGYGWNANGEKVDGVSVGANDCNGELVDGFDADNYSRDQADVVGAKTEGRRGRKKKNLEVLSVSRRVEMFDLNEMPEVQLSPDVLRSRTVGVGANHLVEGDLNKGISEVDEKMLKLENIDDKSLKIIDLNEDPVVHLNPNYVDEENNEGINEFDKKKLNLENIEYKSVEPNNIQNKGRIGRKRKYSQVSSNAQNEEMIDLNQEPVVQLSGRVLRSRTMGGGANDLVDGGLNDVDEEKNEGLNEVDRRK